MVMHQRILLHLFMSAQIIVSFAFWMRDNSMQGLFKSSNTRMDQYPLFMIQLHFQK